MGRLRGIEEHLPNVPLSTGADGRMAGWFVELGEGRSFGRSGSPSSRSLGKGPAVQWFRGTLTLHQVSLLLVYGMSSLGGARVLRSAERGLERRIVWMVLQLFVTQRLALACFWIGKLNRA